MTGKQKILTPFYDPNKSYEENYEKGPFGAFEDKKVYKQKGDPQYDFLGYKVFLPFGIPAGPLINGKFMKAAFNKGFDINVYKTVRTRIKKSNQWPNIVPIDINGNLTLEQAQKGVFVKKDYSEPLAITNSFGNPSFPVEIWQKDISNLVNWTNRRVGQVVCGMIEGTRWDVSFTDQDFLNDWVLAARLMNETRIHAIEANFSCPNEGNLVKQLLCFDIKQSHKIASAIKNEIGNTPLIIKISYFKDEKLLKSFVKELANIVDGISAINTIVASVFDKEGKQALPGGEWRLKSGICGTPVKWAGLEMVKRLKKIREENNYTFLIGGIGGVSSPEDYKEYRDLGADFVMSATGAMWNPYLAQEIKQKYAKI